MIKLALILVVLVGCKTREPGNNFQIFLSGEDGIEFDGTCVVEEMDGVKFIMDFDDKIPYDIKVRAKFIRCVFQKGNSVDDFQLTMYADGVLVRNIYNNARYALLDTKEY